MAESRNANTTNFLTGVGSAFRPNAVISGVLFRNIVIAQIIGIFLLWLVMPKIIPSPMDVVNAMHNLVTEQGLLEELWNSITTAAEAITLSTIIGLAAAYLSVVPFHKPLAILFAALRAVSIIGISFVVVLYFGGGHAEKIVLLTFGMAPFFAKSMIDVVGGVPDDYLDYVRTLRSSEWRVMYETQIIGTLGAAFDVMKQNAAMGWLMLPMVEGLVRSEGGLGALLLNQEKYFSLASVFAIQIVFFSAGMSLDWLISEAKSLVAPWSLLTTKKKVKK